MGTSFRPNLKWAFQMQTHSRNCSPSKFYPHASKGREASFNSARLSFFSAICEEGESSSRETLKTYTCLSEAPQTSADDLLDLDEIEINSRARPLSHFHYGIKNTGPSKIEDNFSSCTSLPTGKASHFDLPIEDGGGHNVNQKTDRQNDDIIVYSGKKVGRRSIKERARDKADKVASQPPATGAAKEKFHNSARFPRKRVFNSRRRRLMVARNEAEMSTGVKVVANLERIRETLEKESEKRASMSCWADAAGIDIKDLHKQLQFGWFCQNELLRSTNSLVLFLAKKYRCTGLPMEDLVQAGAIGVLQGVERFDPKRGFRFSTYIQYWIRKSMSRVVARNSRGIQIPWSLTKAINQIQKARKALNNGSRRYSDDDIAKATGLPLAKVRVASNCLKVVGSVDQKMGDGLNMKYMEFTADTSIQSPEETVKQKLMKKDIFNLLEGLEPRERQVLALRYGLQDFQPKSLEEIGKLLHVSKEWVRKIEKKAMTKLKNEETTGNLCHYLD
ncbi:RNA polymerase sigma factor sigC isoform X2 [Momordica charantia]|uniref:RNA polymerase sigma factor sigC isoform X2 n=1 Tax=Momordica charantia TaxID=3673 RepID=A0A6J1BQJ7_MOMCH|nr:RNA polymerase sigma factor sigC isoform X2 [Momordica charantia]